MKSLLRCSFAVMYVSCMHMWVCVWFCLFLFFSSTNPSIQNWSIVVYEFCFRFRWKACCFFFFMNKSQVYLLYGLHIKVTIDYSKNTFFLCSVLSPFCKLRIKAFNKSEEGVNIGLAKGRTKRKQFQNWTTRAKHFDAFWISMS